MGALPSAKSSRRRRVLLPHQHASRRAQRMAGSAAERARTLTSVPV